MQLLTITVFELLRFVTQQSKNDEDSRKQFNSGGKCICHELIAILRHFGGASSQYLFPSRRSGKIPLLDVFSFCHSVIKNYSFGEPLKPRAPIQLPFEIEKECFSTVSFVLESCLVLEPGRRISVESVLVFSHCLISCLICNCQLQSCLFYLLLNMNMTIVYELQCVNFLFFKLA